MWRRADYDPTVRRRLQFSQRTRLALIAHRIICRAMQGVGGSGVYSLTIIAFMKMVPPRNYDMIMSIASSAMTLALILGPLLGGAINETGAWRWVFLLK